MLESLAVLSHSAGTIIAFKQTLFCQNVKFNLRFKLYKESLKHVPNNLYFAKVCMISIKIVKKHSLGVFVFLFHMFSLKLFS